MGLEELLMGLVMWSMGSMVNVSLPHMGVGQKRPTWVFPEKPTEWTCQEGSTYPGLGSTYAMIRSSHIMDRTRVPCMVDIRPCNLSIGDGLGTVNHL